MIPIGEPTTTVQFLRRHPTVRHGDPDALRRACLQPSELTVPSRKPKIDKFTFNATLRWLLSSIRGGEQTCADVLRQMPADDPDYKKVHELLTHWDGQTGKRRSLDLSCVACDIAPAMVYGWFARISFEIGKNIMKVQVAASAPMMIQASITAALGPDGLDERKMLFESIGLTQPKRGFAIQQNNFQPQTPLPPGDDGMGFEIDQRRLSTHLRDTPRAALPEKVVSGSVVDKDA